MHLSDLKLRNLGIEKERFGRIYAFIDFGNVNYWFEHDERDSNNITLPPGNKLAVDVQKLALFTSLFSEHSRFYFGLDLQNKKSIHIIRKAREYFHKTVTKPIQWIKHYLTDEEMVRATRTVNEDVRGRYIYLPKCNFDVEICVDTIRFLDQFDTFGLFSSDADFAYLVEFLKRRKKQVILFSSGYVSHWLKGKVDLNVNSQQIKKEVTFVKAKPRL